MTEYDAKKDYETLRGLTKLIKNKAIREFTEKMLDEDVPGYFKSVPASSSGKYHPVYALGDGGLVRHTIATVKFIVHISSLEYLHIDVLTRDKMIAACLLHDTYKQGLTGEGGHTVKDHAKVAHDEIVKCAKEQDLETVGDQIAKLVLSHMGEWSNNKPGNRISFLVHLSDYLASRKDILIDFDIPTEVR